MLVALTGTPGTGKTSVAKVLERDFKVIYLKELREFYREYDESRESFVVDIDAMREKFEKFRSEETVILEGHLSHYMPVDIAIVLRCHPEELRKRLEKRGYGEEKVRENLEAEAMGLITSEAIELIGDEVYEVDTTGRTAEDVAKDIGEILSGRGEKFKRRINYMREIMKWY